MISLFYDKLFNKYFIVAEGITCKKCGAVMNKQDPYLLHSQFNKYRPSKQDVYCLPCGKRIICGDYDELKMVHLSDAVLKQFKAVPMAPSILKTSNCSVFEAAYSNEGISAKADNCVVVDRCRVSNDPNRNIMPEYEKTRIAIEKREAELDNPNLDPEKMLNDLKEAEPITIESKQKKELEFKE